MRPRAAIIDVFSVKKAKILAVVNRQKELQMWPAVSGKEGS